MTTTFITGASAGLGDRAALGGGVATKPADLTEKSDA